MFLSQEDYKVFSLLKELGIVEKYPYIENGIEMVADTIEEVFYKAVLSYDTFSLVNKKYKPYSPNDIRNFEALLRYQKEMKAYYAPFQTIRRTITEEDVKAYTHDKLKSIFIKINKKNCGIFYSSSLRGYTSTTLFENPTKEYSEETKRYSKIRLFGCIQRVLPETMKLYDGTILTFEYPYILNGIVGKAESIYEVYRLAYTNPLSFEIIENNDLYSSQQKRVIGKLKSYGGKEIGRD